MPLRLCHVRCAEEHTGPPDPSVQASILEGSGDIGTRVMVKVSVVYKHLQPQARSLSPDL